MNQSDVVIIGGGPAGVVTALTVKKTRPETTVTLIRKDNKVLIPCGIPYIFGTLDDPDKDLLPDTLLADNGIELLIDEATDIDREKKSVSTANGEAVAYQKLVLATGCTSTIPPITGVEREGVYTIKKDYDYICTLKKAVDNATDIVIVGGGFIGAEMADELRKKEKHVTLIEAQPHILQEAFDEAFCQQAKTRLEQAGVTVLTETYVEKINGESRVQSATTSTGDTVPADLVIICVGARPESTIAKKAGLDIDATGGITVNEYTRTSDPDILAVGDCSGTKDFFTIGACSVMLASTATSEARIAGENIFELKVIKQNKGTTGIFSTGLSDLMLATAGLTESKAKEGGFDIVVGEYTTMDRHPSSMPDAQKMTVKLVFSRDSEILLGGQVAGGAGTGELVNLIGLAIQQGMNISEITTLQIGTHPLLTPSPVTYPFIVAAEKALTSTGKQRR